jgi:predicted DNA-binding ribbon-helix-helix protein
MKLVSKSIRVNPALWNHVRGIALQRGLTMQTLVERILTCYSVRSDWRERVDQAVPANLDKRDQEG